MNHLILKVENERDTLGYLLIEPHLERYELEPNAAYELYIDNNMPEKELRNALVATQREGEMVVCSPTSLSPVLKYGGVVVVPTID